MFYQSILITLTIYIKLSIYGYELHCGFNDVGCSSNGYCHGEEINGELKTKCVCNSDYDGPQCQYRKCPYNPCINGFCEYFNGTKISCHCYPGYSGDKCSFKTLTPCDHVDCKHGECIFIGNVPTCRCDPGYMGMTCDKVDNCYLNNCSNNGHCYDSKCQCKDGYMGENCETEVDECLTNKCYPGSKCIDKIGDYECQCQDDRLGKYCEKPNTCIIDGKCLNGRCISYDNGSLCECKHGFSGENCDEDINECEIGFLCNNNGKCINTPGSFYCKCNGGYNDTTCTRDIISIIITSNNIIRANILMILTLLFLLTFFCLFCSRTIRSYDLLNESVE